MHTDAWYYIMLQRYVHTVPHDQMVHILIHISIDDGTTRLTDISRIFLYHVNF